MRIQPCPHPDDGALLRFVDGNAPALERARTDHHVSICDDCVDRVRELADVRDTVLRALHDSDSVLPEMRAQPWGPHGSAGPKRASRGSAARTAAAALVLLAGAALVGVAPLRAWIGEVADRVSSFAAPPSDGPIHGEGSRGEAPARGFEAAKSTGSGQPGEPARPLFTLAFLAQSDTFIVDVRHHQPRGDLNVRIGGDEAFVDVGSRDRLDRLSIVSGGLVIGNTSASQGSYDLVLPASVREVRVRIEGRLVGRLPTAAGVVERSYPLATSP